ncbi:MAG: hypothetical protein PVF58_11090 [Candidatus Methanofastidiosia archaeon]|jgi:hypothetical protein
MKELDILLEKEDSTALNTRIHLLNDTKSQKTIRITKKVVKTLKKTQLPNGSWENTIYTTIPTLGLLVDCGHKDTPLFQNGFKWLLSLKGPYGFHEYSEEGQKVYCRDEYCPYGSELGSPELTGRVLHLCGKVRYKNDSIDEVIEGVMQFKRDDNGFHGPQFWEQDQKGCVGATLWLTRGLLKLHRKLDIVKGCIDFIQKADIDHNKYQFGTSALTLETLYLYSPEKTDCVKAHITYLLSLKNDDTWVLGSPKDRKDYRKRLFTVLKALSRFHPGMITV